MILEIVLIVKVRLHKTVVLCDKSSASGEISE